MAMKYIRKGMSLKDGSVVTEGVSLHEMAVWNVPVWAAAPRGRGQPGQEGDVNFGETVAFDWRELVCGLPEASFELLFSGNEGITGVYLMEVGEIGIHWASQGRGTWTSSFTRTRARPSCTLGSTAAWSAEWWT